MPLPSNRNFILLDQAQQECLLFGKKEDGAYILEISHPFSIAEAFGIAISALDRKINNQVLEYIYNAHICRNSWLKIYTHIFFAVLPVQHFKTYW